MSMSMNVVDIVLLCVVVLAFIFGLIRGFVMQLVQIASLVLGFFLAKKFYDEPVSGIIRNYVDLGSNATMISKYVAFFAIFLATVIVLFFVSYLARDLIRKAKLASFDRFFGGILGAVKGVLICTALYYVIGFFPDDKNREDIQNKLKFSSSHGVVAMEWILERATAMYPTLFDRPEKPRADEQQAEPQPQDAAQ